MIALYFKLHTGKTGVIASVLRKQKLNIKSITQADLVGVDDLSSLILWTKLFMEAQGYKAKQKVYINITKVLSSYRKMGKRVRVKGQYI